MSDRERLVELLECFNVCCSLVCEHRGGQNQQACQSCRFGQLADYLLNGGIIVTLPAKAKEGAE